MNIGFIGLGNMGSGMARNLLAHCQSHGCRLLVFDINTAAVDRLIRLGAAHGRSVPRLAAQVEVLFTSLPGAGEINQLGFGAHGILQTLPANAVWFETSTNEPSQWEKLVAQAADKLTLIDAPVTGGAEGAAAGALTMLIGGDEQVLETHRGLVASIAGKAVYMGPSGAGYVAKLCQLHLNYLAAQGVGEAMMLAAKSGLNLQTLHEVLMNSCAQSYVADHYIPRVLDGSYDPSFTLGLAARDMRLVSDLGRHLNVELTLGESVYARYQKACMTYGGDAPHLSSIRLIEEQSQKLLRG